MMHTQTSTTKLTTNSQFERQNEEEIISIMTDSGYTNLQRIAKTLQGINQSILFLFCEYGRIRVHI